jgi:hypothetical protein
MSHLPCLFSNFAPSDEPSFLGKPVREFQNKITTLKLNMGFFTGISVLPILFLFIFYTVKTNGKTHSEM